MSDDGTQFSTTASVQASVQLTVNKMKEANLKYKSLLKLAKERIQAQEEELESLRGTLVHLMSITPRANSITLEQRETNQSDSPLTFFASHILTVSLCIQRT
jgi:hypothetical protein